MASATTEPKRAKFRFSIRVMMLVVLIIAVWLGWRVSIARKQRAVVAAVEQAGGWVHYDYEFVSDVLTPGQNPWAPFWLRKILGDEYFRQVRQVSLVYDESTGKRFDNKNVDACDNLLKQMTAMPGLKELLLKETQATDEGLRQIGKMTELRQLYIWDARSVTDAGVSHLRNLRNLREIHINNSKITDDSLVLLSSLPSMEKLSFQGNHFSDEGLVRLQGSKRLKSLHIGLGDLQVTDAGIAHLRDFDKLEVLDIQGSGVTAEGLEHLKELPNLKELWMGKTDVTEAEFKRFQSALPKLKVRK
jgi:hypothetical protein